MANGDQINIKPHFQASKVPCEGQAGDLLVMTELQEGDIDGSPQGLVSLWFCTKSEDLKGGRRAVWKRVQFDNYANCEMTVPKPPQNTPPIGHG